MRPLSRVYVLVVAVAFTSSGIGSWIGPVGPTWPPHEVWAVLAWFVAAFSLFHAILPSPARLRAMTVTIVCVGALRVVGFLLFASSTGSRFAGAGGWLLIVVLAVRVHVAERRAIT